MTTKLDNKIDELKKIKDPIEWIAKYNTLERYTYQQYVDINMKYCYPMIYTLLCEAIIQADIFDTYYSYEDNIDDILKLDIKDVYDIDEFNTKISNRMIYGEYNKNDTIHQIDLELVSLLINYQTENIITLNISSSISEIVFIKQHNDCIIYVKTILLDKKNTINNINIEIAENNACIKCNYNSQPIIDISINDIDNTIRKAKLKYINEQF